MAYHLKAYNTKTSDYLRRKFRRKLYIFEEQCELIGYLADKTTVRYKEPGKRTAEYNVKYETFFALQHNVPTLNWLTWRSLSNDGVPWERENRLFTADVFSNSLFFFLFSKKKKENSFKQLLQVIKDIWHWYSLSTEQVVLQKLSAQQ